MTEDVRRRLRRNFPNGGHSVSAAIRADQSIRQLNASMSFYIRRPSQNVCMYVLYDYNDFVLHQ